MEGWRGRIGVIFPGTSIIDGELWQWVPPGVTVHISRIPVKNEYPGAPYTLRVALESYEGPELEGAADQLRLINPTAVVFACTSGSFAGGPGHDRAMIARLAPAALAPVTTTSTAIMNAARALGASRLAVASPYLSELSEKFGAFLDANGFDIVGMKTMNSPGGTGYGAVPPSDVYQLARAVDVASADAVVVACTGLHTFDVLETLEMDLGKPVISANQASMWDAMRLSGVSATGLQGRGQLYKLAGFPTVHEATGHAT